MSDVTRPRFKCYYCTSKANQCADIVKHCVQEHKTQTLKYRELILHHDSGFLKYLTKTHSGIVPARLENEGKFIEVRGNQTFISRKTPKRKKLNTPVKDNYSALCN